MPVKTRPRQDRVREWMDANEIDVVLLIDPENTEYATGYSTQTYSRPLVTVIRPDRTTLVVPSMEYDHALLCDGADRVVTYWEIPEHADEPKTYLQAVERALDGLASGARAGIEAFRAPWELAELLRAAGHHLTDAGRKVARLRAIKSAEELELIRVAAGLVEIGVRDSLAVAAAGVSEMEIDAAGTKALGAVASQEHPGVVVGGWATTLAGAQRTTVPHAPSGTRRLEAGDVWVHNRQVSFDGYRAELERTCFIGEPTEEQVRAFEIMREARRRAFETIRAGVAAGVVDRASRSAFQEAGVGEHAWGRIGHGIGLGPHEEPYLRFDSELVLEPGMVVTIEPGHYLQGIGGYRHSDTVVVTGDGYEKLTSHPEELEHSIVSPDGAGAPA
jgi:Xaa-Pro dipeptidase